MILIKNLEEEGEKLKRYNNIKLMIVYQKYHEVCKYIIIDIGTS